MALLHVRLTATAIDRLQLEITWPLHLSDLPDELQLHVLTMAGGAALGVAACVQRSWSLLSPCAARSAYGERLDDETPPPPNWARALAAAETLEAAVGPPPKRLRVAWRSEWTAMRMEAAALFAEANGRLEAFQEQCRQLGDELAAAFADGGILSLAAEVRNSYARSIAWKQVSGWAEEAAVTTTLLAGCGSGALACAMRDRSRRFAGSTHALCRALSARAWADAASARAPPPDAFASLGGEFGLATEDPAWHALRPDAPVGTRFTTGAVGLTMSANGNSFADDRGFRCPVNERGVVRYELRESDVVRLRSRRADRSGCRALVATDEDVFRLPPLASVRLERVDPPGAWRANGFAVQRRLFTVVFAYG